MYEVRKSWWKWEDVPADSDSAFAGTRREVLCSEEIPLNTREELRFKLLELGVPAEFASAPNGRHDENQHWIIWNPVVSVRLSRPRP